MSKFSEITKTSVCVLAFASTVAHANGLSVYNTVCQIEIREFQDASNVKSIEKARHSLLLCLADNAYATANQLPSDYTDWSDTQHFRVFSRDPEVKVGDERQQVFSMTETVQVPPIITGTYGTIGKIPNGISSGWSDGWCNCLSNEIVRSQGDGTNPVKREGFDVYMMVDLGGVLATGHDSLGKVQATIDKVRGQMPAPLSAEFQAANVVAQLGQFNAAELEGTYAPNATVEDAVPGLEPNNWSTDASKVTATASSGGAVQERGKSCGCKPNWIPIERSGGDAVPSTKSEDPDVYFYTNNIGGLTDWLKANPVFSSPAATFGNR